MNFLFDEIYTTRILVKNTRMTTKLTLTVEKTVIDRAKACARKPGRSLSEIIENYLQTLAKHEHGTELSPKIKKIVGVVKLPKNFDQKKELHSYFEKKHL
jgi:hypothetical protein